MNFKNSFRLSITLVATIFGMASIAAAQDKPADKGATLAATAPSAPIDSEKTCFADGDPIVDNMPKRTAKKREQQIIDKILRVVTQGYGSQQATFSHIDKDHDCKLDRSEVSDLLSESKVNGFVRMIATGRLIDRYDVSGDGYVEWPEFHFAIDKALNKQAEKRE